MKHYSQNRALISACVLSLIATAGWSQRLTWVGGLNGCRSMASGVSADGSVVVGVAQDATGRYRAFRWVLTDPDIGAGVMQDLGTLGGERSGASGVSADGSVVVGGAQDATGRYRAFRWVLTDPDTGAGVMQDLGTLGGEQSYAYGVSADGSVVVGWAQDATGRYRAFRWTENEGIQDLDTSVDCWSWASAVSADGRVVVGTVDCTSSLPDGYAFRWTESAGMQNLGTLNGWVSIARDVSADGSVVIGSSHTGLEQFRAFRWTELGGMENLSTTYTTDGSILYDVYAISPDGRYIVGDGYNARRRSNEAFLLDTGFPLRGDVDRNGCIDDADLLRVLFEFGGRGYRNEDITWDGTIDDADLLQVLFNFGQGC